MKLRVKYGHWLPRLLGAEAVTIYPFVFFSEPLKLVKRCTLVHEMIHVRQVRRRGLVRVGLRYYFEYFRNFLKCWNWDQAYRDISFEKEAYDNQNKMHLTLSERRELKL